MAVIGTFGQFTTARLAIYASQASLSVTGNNIANINTTGYTRQRMDLVSLYSTGQGKYANIFNTNVGYGVLTRGATQLRDPYLDIRYRNENAKLGANEETLDCLYQISSILDEVGKGTGDLEGYGVIEAQLGLLKKALENQNTHAGSEEYDNLVRSAANVLCTYFNKAADDLADIKEHKVNELNESISDINKLLTNIRDLNVQIRTQGIYGEKALELRDARNVALDQLSKYMHINVEYSMERIDQFTEVEKLTVTIANSKGPDGEPIKLVDGIYGGQITMPGTMPEENPNADNKAILDAMEQARKDAEAAGRTKEEIEQAVEAERAKQELIFGKYLMKDGVTATDDITKAATTPNYDAEDPTAEDINRYLLQVEQLVDQRGRVMKDKNEPSGKSEIVTLGDTTLCGKSDDPLRGDSTPAGTLQAIREMLTRKGEYSSSEDQALDPSCTTKRGLPYYQAALDNLAQKFAAVFNKENQLPASTVYKNNGINFFDADGKKLQYTDANGQLQDITLDMVTRVVKDKDGKPVLGDDGQPLREPLSEPLNTPKDIALAAECLNILRQKGAKEDGYGYYQGGVLFSNRGDNDDPTGITAANISVSDSWDNHSVRILNTKEKSKVSAETGEMSHTTARDNISHFISLFDQKMDYLASESRENATLSDLPVHKGSFREVFTAISGTLGNDKQAIAGKVENYTVSALSLENNRQSVSGVDLNEEATSMMQFSKSYSAACRLLTTIDSMLDTLINGTAR
jgi:flagellar hook-associated protein 1 FlgK